MRTLLALLILFASAGSASAACSLSDLDQAGRAVKQARAALMAIPVPEGDESVSPAARTSIETLKDRLRSFAAQTMACAQETLDVRELQATLSTKGDAFTRKNYDKDGHGQELTYDVKVIPSHPDLVGLTASIEVECGVDTMLMIYQRHGRDWQEILVRRSAPYKDVSGAWLSFQYAVSPNDERGQWYVATSNIPAWCSSVWRGIRYDLSRPGPKPDRPDVFFEKLEDAYIGNDNSGQLVANAATFEIQHEVGSIDFNVFTRKALRRYSISRDIVQRIQPVALNPRDFVDEWVMSPWSDSKSWSVPALKDIHDRLNKAGEGASADNAFGSLRACPGGERQVELALGQTGKWFFRISQGPDFRMLTVIRTPSTTCK